MAASVGYPRSLNEASPLFPLEEEESYPNYLCIRNPNGYGKSITNLVSGCLVLVGVGTLVANYYDWKSRLVICLSGAAIGGGLEALLKFNLSPSKEAVWDEFLHYTAPIVIQVLTQLEINTNHHEFFKTLWFALFSAHLSALSLSHLTNVLSANAAQLSGQASYTQTEPQQLYGDTKNFKSVLKFQSLYVITSLALVALGIWQLATTQDILMFNLANNLVGREIGLLGTQPLLDWVEELRLQEDASIQGDQVIPTSKAREFLTMSLKVFPLTLNFIYGVVAAVTSNWYGSGNLGYLGGYGYLGIGVACGASCIIKARHAERGSQDSLFKKRPHESWTQLFLNATTPYARYLFSKTERANVSTKRIYIDIAKGTLALATVAGLVAWMGYWFFVFNNIDDRAQTSTAIISSVVFSLVTSSIMAWCSTGDSTLQRSTMFQLENLQDIAGPFYLTFFDQFILKKGSISKGIPMWIFWALLFIIPLIIESKKRQMGVKRPPNSTYLWNGYFLPEFIKHVLKG